MKRLLILSLVWLPMLGLVGCKKKGYVYTMKVLRENQAPAEGFQVEAWIKDRGEHQTKTTGPDGIALFDTLPLPDSTHQLVGVVHYYNGARDSSRKITYPYLESDAQRLKDTQYIPAVVTPAPTL